MSMLLTPADTEPELVEVEELGVETVDTEEEVTEEVVVEVLTGRIGPLAGATSSNVITPLRTDDHVEPDSVS